MAIRFLCRQHREQLQSSPETGEAYWEQWLERGGQLLKRGDAEGALHFLGCSFELSEMLLDQQAPVGGGRWRPADRFMVSGHYLAEGFARCQQPDLERHCLLAVHHRLLQDMRRCPGDARSLKANLEISLIMLKRHFTAHNEFCLLAQCYNEGLLALQALSHRQH